MNEAFDSAAARRAAARLVGGEPRWSHVRTVAATAADVASAVAEDDVELLLAAAWLHDIGYAAELVDTGFHPLDGARHLRSSGAPDRLCCLVANHTRAWVEAAARGLAATVADEFPVEDSPVADALTFADLTSGPHGERVTAEARIAEILERYEPGHYVHESIRRGTSDLIATVRRVEARLRAGCTAP